MERGERDHMKKENTFLDLMGEIDEKFIYEASLPWKKRNSVLRLKLIKAAAAGIAIVLLAGSFGHTKEIKAAWGQFTSWIQTALGIHENVESYVDSIGKTITKNGISITIDEIVADKDNLWVALSNSTNSSEEKEIILLTEVNVNGKPAQLDGTYNLTKEADGTERQVCHYRMEDTAIKGDAAEIKMNIWTADPEKMDEVDTEDTEGYVFEFQAGWKELEQNTRNVNVDKTIKISANENLMISEMSLNEFSSIIYGSSDSEAYEDYYLLGTDNEGNQGFYRLINNENGQIVFEESRNDIKYKGISPKARSVTLELYVNKEEKSRTKYKKYEIGTEDIYEEGDGKVYESGEDPVALYSQVGEKIEIRIK